MTLKVFECEQAPTQIAAPKITPAFITERPSVEPAFTLHMFAVTCSTLAPYVTERSSPQATCTRFRVERSVRMLGCVTAYFYI